MEEVDQYQFTFAEKSVLHDAFNVKKTSPANYIFLVKEETLTNDRKKKHSFFSSIITAAYMADVCCIVLYIKAIMKSSHLKLKTQFKICVITAAFLHHGLSVVPSQRLRITVGCTFEIVFPKLSVYCFHPLLWIYFIVKHWKGHV